MTSHRGRHASTAGTSTAEAQDWRNEAACRDMDVDFFYPEGRGRKLGIDREKAKQFCRDHCPVIDQCREAARGERHGIWGGTDERDRGYDTRGQRRQEGGLMRQASGISERGSVRGHDWLHEDEEAPDGEE